MCWVLERMRMATLFEALGRRWSCSGMTLHLLWLGVAMPIRLPPAHFIFCDDLNEKDSWFPSPSAQSPTQTNRLHAWQTALGLCAVSSTQEWSIALKEKINKQAKSTPALCLRGNRWVPWLPCLPCCHSPEPRGENRQWRKEAVSSCVCVHVHVYANVYVRETDKERDRDGGGRARERGKREWETIRQKK